VDNETIVYEGGMIGGIAIDSGYSLLYFTDTTAQEILKLDYSLADVFNTTTVGEVAPLLKNDTASVVHAGPLTTNYASILFWGATSNGKEDGSIFYLNLEADVLSPIKLTANADSVVSLSYYDETLYYIADEKFLYGFHMHTHKLTLVSD